MPEIPGKGKHGHVDIMYRGQPAAQDKTPYHIDTYRSPQRGYGILWFARHGRALTGESPEHA